MDICPVVLPGRWPNVVGKMPVSFHTRLVLHLLPASLYRLAHFAPTSKAWTVVYGRPSPTRVYLKTGMVVRNTFILPGETAGTASAFHSFEQNLQAHGDWPANNAS